LFVAFVQVLKQAAAVTPQQPHPQQEPEWAQNRLPQQEQELLHR
jgi:hypothetical protein